MEDNFEIQKLIEEKDFNNLTLNEVAFVESEVSRDEYILRRNMVISVKQFLEQGVNNVNPETLYKKDIRAILNARKKESTSVFSFRHVFEFKIPVLIPAVAIVLLLFILPAYFKTQNQPKKFAQSTKIVQPKLIYKTDTLFVEKKVAEYIKVPTIKYIEVVKEKEIDFSKELISSINYENSLPIIPGNENNFSVAQEQLNAQLKNIGKSASEQEELNKFLVQAK